MLRTAGTGPEQQREIAPHRPAGDVALLQIDDVLEVGDRRFDRPPATGPVMPGSDLEADVVARLVPRDFARQRRPRADERHLAAQHVPELRQLVEAAPAQEASDRRDARIVRRLEQLRVADRRWSRASRGARASASRTIVRSLSISNDSPPSPTRRLAEEDRPARRELHGERATAPARARAGSVPTAAPLTSSSALRDELPAEQRGAAQQRDRSLAAPDQRGVVHLAQRPASQPEHAAARGSSRR